MIMTSHGHGIPALLWGVVKFNPYALMSTEMMCAHAAPQGCDLQKGGQREGNNVGDGDVMVTMWETGCRGNDARQDSARVAM
jgi:hypothetical protein